ncbi:MAG: hypothetical protein IKW14_04950, partial [Phascolarctobacterium sp.]|nr:hypothetical protein [Phascolarctobacterium sp.]
SSKRLWQYHGSSPQINVPGKLDDESATEMLVFRPVIAKVVTMAEVNSGSVTLVDLLKINALLDMKSDTEYYLSKKDGGRQ